MKQSNHGGDLIPWKQRYPGRKWVDFSSNCNPWGMPEAVKRAYLDGLEDCERYPDPHCRELLEAVGRWEGVPSGWVVPGNGASDLICRVSQVLQPDRALVTAPTFSEYRRALEQTGCLVEEHTLSSDQGFTLDDSILEKLEGIDLLFLCSPNNPTGQVILPQLLEEITAVCRKRNIWLVMDECFRDLLQEGEYYTAKRYLAESPRLLILNAFTKSFAMAGLRMGYAICADPAVVKALKNAGAEWSVSAPAQRCGVAAAGEAVFLAEAREILANERVRLTAGLERCGVRVFPSQANYLLFYTEVVHFQARLAERGLLLRSCSNYSGLGRGYYRAAVRRPEENNRLMEAIHDIYTTKEERYGQAGEIHHDTGDRFQCG